MQILIVKTSSLGDIIQTLPVISFLRGQFPQAQIDFVVEKPFKELLEALPEIRRVIPVEMRKWKKNPLRCRKKIALARKDLRKKHYDLLIDLQGNIKSALITQSVRAKEKVGMTFSSAAEWPNSLFLTHRYPLEKGEPISLQYLYLVQRHFAIKPHPVSSNVHFTITNEENLWIDSQLKEGKCFMVCPGSTWENKKLSIPTWIDLLKRIAKEEDPHFYFVWGSPKEEQEALALHAQFPKRSSVLPRMRLPLWQQMMTRMDKIFTVDSSALHLAATTNTPTYSFFGPSSSAIYKPPGEKHKAFQGKCPYGKTFSKRCGALRTCKTGACLKEVSATTLLELLNSRE